MHHGPKWGLKTWYKSSPDFRFPPFLSVRIELPRKVVCGAARKVYNVVLKDRVSTTRKFASTRVRRIYQDTW
eukprot:455120-Rhodomonas_salina.1